MFYYWYYRFSFLINLIGLMLFIGGIHSLLNLKQDSYSAESRSTSIASSLVMIIVGGFLSYRLILSIIRLFT